MVIFFPYAILPYFSVILCTFINAFFRKKTLINVTKNMYIAEKTLINVSKNAFFCKKKTLINDPLIKDALFAVYHKFRVIRYLCIERLKIQIYKNIT